LGGKRVNHGSRVRRRRVWLVVPQKPF
jgi:hypothetical protein